MIGRALAFAFRSLRRQPARALLGILGIAAVGALLFDMLLLSRGLLVSFKTLLDAAGFDVRVVATESLPLMGPPIADAHAAVAALRALPEVEEVVPLRFGEARAADAAGRPLKVAFSGADADRRRPWRLLEGQDLAPAAPATPHPLLVNRNLAQALRVRPGAELLLRMECGADTAALPPVRFRVVGVAEYPFDEATALTAVTTLATFQSTCDTRGDDAADLLLVAAKGRGGAAAAVSAIRKIRPDLHPFSNEELVERFQQVGFSYFKQISTVLSTVTLLFAFLLISVLLTVSAHQRLGEIAALRALGLSRLRVVADVLFQSVLMVAIGGALSLPLGLALATWLDAILRAIPDIPREAHFFVFEPRAVAVHAALLAGTAILAALYPMQLVARLPIATTLRNEVVT